MLASCWKLRRIFLLWFQRAVTAWRSGPKKAKKKEKSYWLCCRRSPSHSFRIQKSKVFLFTNRNTISLSPFSCCTDSRWSCGTFSNQKRDKFRSKFTKQTFAKITKPKWRQYVAKRIIFPKYSTLLQSETSTRSCADPSSAMSICFERHFFR